jgi:glucosamine--fructose-6-phosphate aminotransferase (isomerizing)
LGSSFLEEIHGQPEALRRLLEFYGRPDGQRALSALPAPHVPALAGMGASYHCAQLAAGWLQRGGLPAFALESVDLVQEPGELLDRLAPLIYISQSGASAEVRPLLRRLAADQALVALTNEPGSPLAQGAPVVLPLLAGAEATVASKTYINSLAILWLVSRTWLRRTGGALAELGAVQTALEALVRQAEGIAREWLDHLGDAEALVFVGHGLHAVTARQAAMMTMEWVKAPALSASVGAFRHGPIELAQPGVALVVFAPPGPRQASALALAEEARGYGMAVRVVVHGWSGTPEATRPNPPPVDECLAPLLDIVPVQLFVEALARHRGVLPGFRHISKIIDRM